MRVYELAKKVDKSSKEMIEVLKGLGIEVTSHMSGLSDEDVEKVKSHLSKKEEKREKKKVKKKKPKKKKTAKKEKPKKKEKKEPEKKPKKKAKKKVKKKPKKEVKEKEEKKEKLKEVEVAGRITVYELAKLLDKSEQELLKRLKDMGEDIDDIASLVSYEALFVIGPEYGVEFKLPEDEAVEKRPPVIAFLGHVDHGKTSLLDAIRKTNVVRGESGGITQHIGVSEITTNGNRLSFIDTPGHSAFTGMRARGADVTDIVVLVIAADDGVMPQTIEALNHAKAADVAIIVAINKMDKPGANPDVIKMELRKYDIIPDDQGGDTQYCLVSATENTGIDELLESIILQGEIMELKGYPERRPVGVVVEAKLDKHRGPVATVLMKEGTLKSGDEFMIGSIKGKVRAMTDSSGERVESAGPSKAVEIMGLNDVPESGDILITAEKEVIEELTEYLAEKSRVDEISTPRISLDDWFSQLQDGGVKELNVIVKGDVYGTSEVINDILGSIGTDNIKLNVIHSGVGNINENDVLLADASDAIVIGFGVSMDKQASQVRNKMGVDVRTYDIIYDLIEDIEMAIEGMLEPEVKEVLVGKVEVRKIFNLGSANAVAGSFVRDGVVTRGAKAKVIRDDEEIHTGRIATLRRFESDVKEVKKGFECGVTIEGFKDFQEGDMIFVYKERRIKRTFKISDG